MSDRRAVSAGRLGASSVAVTNEPWRVAIGGNRVQSMTIDQIAQAYRMGQLTVRTPLWPPGASGWQALGNFEHFQAAPGFDGPPPLTQFEEADDAPTRMWTGSGDLSELEMSPAALGGTTAPALPAEPMTQPHPEASRPPARTGTRPVARSVAAQPVRNSTTMPGLATTRAGTPARSSGLWLVAGLVGLVALGSAVLAVRGSWSTTASARPSAPDVSTDSSARPVAAASGNATRESAGAAPHGAEVNQAQLAKYEDAPAGSNVAAANAKAEETTPAAATIEAKPEPGTAAAAPGTAAPEPAAPEAPRASRHSSRSESARVARRERLARHEREREAASETRTAEVRSSADRSSEAKAGEPKLGSAVASKRDSASTELPKSKSARNEAKADAKADSQPVSAAVNDAAATALTNASKLAASCRPPGGPSGEGKARVIYSQDGDVQSVEILTAKFRDTLTGSCVRMVFRRAKIPPFRGEAPTFIKSFKIPEE
jgi:hypothetical protein